MFASPTQAADEPAWTGFAMEQIMKTLSFVNSSLVQAPKEEKDKFLHKLDDTLYCAKVRLYFNIINSVFSMKNLTLFPFSPPFVRTFVNKETLDNRDP